MEERWHQIWIKAIKANQELILNHPRGEDPFRELCVDHPTDGMVYYERGEAYEYLKQLDLAASDYEKAAEYFPLKHWKDVAHEGLERTCPAKWPPAVGIPKDRLGAISHRIHTVPQIPHYVRVDALFAAARFYTVPYMAAAQLRMALERLVVTLLDHAKVRYSEKDGLNKLIERLQSESKIPNLPIVKMHTVRELGNKAIHMRGTSGSERSVFEPSLLAFVEILEDVGKSSLWQTRPT